MPRSAITGVFVRVSNSFSNPVFGTLIDPTDAEALFDDQDDGLNPPKLAGPLAIVGSLSVSTGLTALTYNKVTITAPATAATLTLIDGTTLTGPAASDTLVGRASTDTLTNKTLTNPAINGATILTSTYNKVTITAPVTSATLTLIDGTTITGPAATGTLVTKTSTDILTNKTYDTAGAGNNLSINSVAVTTNTGTGAVARAVSPTFTTPVLGVASATSMAVGTATLGGYILKVLAGNANQLGIDNAGEQFTELDYLNSGVAKAVTFYDNSSNLFAFRTTGAATIRFDTANTPRMTIASGAGDVTITGGFASAAPTTKTGNYTMLIGDSSLIFNNAASSTLTLLAASSFSGRELWIKNIAAGAVVSASSNVVPRAGGAASTPILAGGAGTWAFLKSDGTNWQIMASN